MNGKGNDARWLRLRDRLREKQDRLPGRDLRPLWRGQSYERSREQPMAVRRALALAAVLERMALRLRDDEILVGAPSGVLAAHLPSGVSDRDYARYAAIDQQVGERTFVSNYDHCAVNFAKLLRVGFGGLVKETEDSLQRHHAAHERQFLRGVLFALSAAQRYIKSWASVTASAAGQATAARAPELRRMSADLAAVAFGAPATFSQALQLVWLVHTIFSIEGRGAMAFGRMDQYLWPFYQHEVEAGRAAEARDLLCCLWAKMEEPLIPNPVLNIAIGGQTRDGADATNALSHAILDVTRTIRTPHSNLSARLHAQSPATFVDACCELIKTGIGFPALFNDEVLIPALTDLGIPLEDARDYAFVGCIETFLPGRMPPWSDSRVNLLAALDHTMRDGVDGLTGLVMGARTGPVADLGTYDDFFEAYCVQVRHLVREHAAAISERKAIIDPEQYPSPLLSALIDDCIARGRDVNAGGARFADLHGPAGMGLGTTADALAAIRRFVYDRGEITWDELIAALDADYCGRERLRLRLLNGAPKYGNGDPYVDNLAARVAEVFTSSVREHRTPGGGYFVPLMAANVANIAAGHEVGATPDGRRAREPLSDAASPTFGRDRHGPTAVIESLSRVNYRPAVGGTVVNMRFSPSTLSGCEGTALLRTLVRTYFARGGMQLQFNVTGRETLVAAREAPETYRDLVVRVSGFSALYVNLSDAVQCDILARTEH